MTERVRGLFTLHGRVARRPYALTGCALMALKYGVEALAFRLVTGANWTPFDYLAPFYSVRASKLEAAPNWFLLVLGLWTLPFVWIGAGMSLRRARDAGFGSTSVLLFFVPVLNYAWMIALAALPASARVEEEREQRVEPGAPFRAALPAVGLTALAGLAATAFCVYVADTYATALFLGVPFLLGFSSGFQFNRGGDRGLRSTVGVALLATAIAGLLLLLFALEGLVCIVMAAGIVLPLACFGAVFGRAAANSRGSRATLVPALLLPPLALLEARVAEPALFEVVTAIEVDAPPERVWPNVVGFADLPRPAHWIFSTGIAYPLRARIEGEGVGAVRRCEFSTGAFVEPITAWEPPVRLAFDVRECPPPMEEWSFYARVRPPHLAHAFRAVRGEFRMLALEGGRTRLEGSTWYELDLFPLAYWRLLSDLVVRRIHGRVLEHVATLSENS